MMFTRMIGAAEVSNVIEYSGPTHDPGFLFPDMPAEVIEQNLSWLAPHHFNRRLHKFVVTIQIWAVRLDSSVIVVDTGVGNFKARRAARMNNLNTLMLDWLAAAGAGPADVTHVVHTHMHTDHVGWDTRRDGEDWVPTFPNARYLYPKVDFDRLHGDFAAKRMSADAAGVFADSVAPIVDRGLVDLIEADAVGVAGCLDAEPLPGHTAGMLSFRLRSQGEEGVFAGDVMHSPLQIVAHQYNTAFCEVKDRAPATRKAFLERAAERNALIMPCHYGAPYCGRVRRTGDRFSYGPEHG
jgi:glyoxylase-like metal-dependent hydrolase (beta-lactamase superfamily II)